MSHDVLLYGFFAALGATVVALGLALWLAHVHKPRAHIAAVGGFLVVFLVTVAFAELLGRHYDFTQPSFGIHMVLALSTTLFALIPIWSGWQHWFGKMPREKHQRLAQVFLVMVVLSLGTGVWMLASATRKATPVADAPAPVPSTAR